MSVVSGVARHCPGSLVKLLHDAGSEFRHLPCHLQNHLASLLSSNACPVILSPGPHIFHERPVRPAGHRSLSPVGTEIRHSIIAGIALPGYPAKTISVEKRKPSFLLCLCHEPAHRRIAPERREGIRLDPWTAMFPVVDKRHQRTLEFFRKLI